MIDLKKEKFRSLTLASLFSVALVGCVTDSDGDGPLNSDSASEGSSEELPVYAVPGEGDQVDSDNSIESSGFEVLQENNSNILVRSLLITSEASSQNIPDQNRIDVYPVQSPTENDQSFKFEWDIQSSYAVIGADALVFRKNSVEVRAVSFLANANSSMLSHYANCLIDTAYSLTCEVPSTSDNIGFIEKVDLSELQGSEVGELVVESEFCSVVNGCNRYRVGRIYIH